MNCLCCGKPLKTSNDSGWHKNCIKHFFGTSVLPEIELSSSGLELIIGEAVRKGLTVPGVQKKISLHLFSEGKQPRAWNTSSSMLFSRCILRNPLTS